MVASLHHILAPVDFSDASQWALQQAATLATRLGAQLDVLHVIEEPTFPTFYALGAEALYGHMPDLEARVDQELAALAGRIDAMPNTAERLVRRGRAVPEILHVVEERGADLVVLAAHGQGGIKHLLLGSVAEKVVRNAPCSVLVAKPPED